MTKQWKMMRLKRQNTDHMLNKKEQSSFFSLWHQCKCWRDRGWALQHWTPLATLVQDRKHGTFRIFHHLSSSLAIAGITGDVLIPHDTYIQISVNFTCLRKAGLCSLDLAKSCTILFLWALGRVEDMHCPPLLQELSSFLKFMDCMWRQSTYHAFPVHGGSFPRPTPSTGV